MKWLERRPYRDATPTRVHVLMGIAGAGLILLTALSVTSVTRDKLDETHLVERATQRGEEAGRAAAKVEIRKQVSDKIDAAVSDKVDRTLYPNLYPPFRPLLPPEAAPVDPVSPSPTTTTVDPNEGEPFDLTTTTLPEEVPTTTTIEVPTTVTIPDPPPLP